MNPLAVLIVGAELAMNLGLEATLARLGHVVVGVAQGVAQALEHAAAAHPDLVLMEGSGHAGWNSSTRPWTCRSST